MAHQGEGRGGAPGCAGRKAGAAHKSNEATRLPAEEAAAEAAAEALHKAQRESDEFLDNLLESVEDFDKQVHSITTREDSLELLSFKLHKSMVTTNEWIRTLQGAHQQRWVGDSSCTILSAYDAGRTWCSARVRD